MQHLTKLNKSVFFDSTYNLTHQQSETKTWHETKMAFQDLTENIMAFVESFPVCCL